MKKLLCLCFAINILFCSCSIQKRVHQPGYAIEWYLGKRVKPQHKETARSKTPLNKTAELQQAEKATEEFVPSTGSMASGTTNEADRPLTQPADVKIMRQAKQASPAKVIITDNKPLLIKRTEQYKPLHKTSDDKIIKGLSFVLVALLLLGLGLIFAFALGLVGIIFLLIFGIAAVIFLVFGIFMMIVGLLE